MDIFNYTPFAKRVEADHPTVTDDHIRKFLFSKKLTGEFFRDNHIVRICLIIMRLYEGNKIQLRRPQKNDASSYIYDWYRMRAYQFISKNPL